MLRILVAYGSKDGGTAGLAEMIGDALADHGYDVEVLPAGKAPPPEGYDAVVVAGALYANHWHRSARRYVRLHVKTLRTRPVWLVASGPLDDSARKGNLPAVPHVAELVERIGARGEVTFGGRLLPDAKGFPASVMARTHAGDWRDADHVREFAAAVAADLAAPRAATS
ncbi:MAG TPA: flavodoxin domain-containing protein [Acidimicrobiales bacterium]|nr:flavodoxin domain-containing protein [Acidimicrobiales bacterium]